MFILPILLQITPPFEGPGFEMWQDIMENLLNLFFVFSQKGYIFLLILGFMVYATTLSDSSAKTLVGFSVFFYFVGPLIVDLLANSAGLSIMTIDEAAIMWLHTFGLTDSELLYVVLAIGDFVAAVAILIGAILYFNPTSNDLKSKGHSLIVRGFILLPVLAFVYLIPWA